ncbi:dihydropteroate synthase [Jannaschia seohaensis]|uniref:Dihydropteroate synthase n=1 Tax=Jannaschia seohaensis TaxID=475081 RepID=A0A2Y9AR20_9RHOB|nr:dihydropteroate synthase [Jannaschia seohaensis]PWJ18309.1 dihydropteroate synthase [Jannaschia seohaensis]SSA46834.1 dihydropteroate synthase [Jannaschia seohaensis]
MIRLRPLPSPEAAAEAPRLAGGWLRFDRVELLERGRAPQVLPWSEIPAPDLARLTAPRPPLAGLTLDRPRIMGILNITPDSFSDGGRHLDPADALARAEALAAADILDIGGESTRPGAQAVPASEETARILPVVEALRDRRLSIDTRKAAVARAALAAGGDIVNDVAAGAYDPAMFSTVAETGAPMILMHSVATPETMQDDPRYDDVIHDVMDALAARIAAAEAAGIPRARLVVDPGIGFGKTRAHNLALLRRIGVFHDLGLPVLLGASRKRFIGDIGGAPQAEDRASGTLAVTLAAVAQGVQIHRVHDVAPVAQGLALWRAVTEE